MDDSIHKDNLIAKYWAISSGLDYRVTNVAPLLIAKFGGAITSLNVGTHGGKLNCKPDMRTDEELIKIGMQQMESVRRFNHE